MSDRKPKYWICQDCADNKNCKLNDHAVTMILGLCGWCDREDKGMLIPVVDFKKVTNE